MNKLLILNTAFLDDDGSEVGVELLIREGTIERVAAPNVIREPEAAVFDAEGATVWPGVIDGHVHMRKGQEHKEDMRSVLAAAYAGGVTTLGEMPNSEPNITSVAAMESVLEANEVAGAPVITHAGATVDNLSELRRMVRLKHVKAIKVVRSETTGQLLVPNDEPLKRILALASDEGVAVLLHTGVQNMVDEAKLRHREEHAKGCMAACHDSIQSAEAEIIGGRRDIAIIRDGGYTCPVLFRHVSAPRLLDSINRARELGSTNIVAAVTGHHITLDRSLTERPDGTFFKVNPPLRNNGFRDVLERRLCEGFVQIFESDHAPHAKHEKEQEYAKAPSGLSGIQTLFPIILNLVAKGRLKPSLARAMTAEHPAEFYGLHDRGEIAAGKRADLTFVDLHGTWTINESDMYSKAKHTPYAGMTLQGLVVATMVGGRLVYDRRES